jgi:hypothetical protein
MGDGVLSSTVPVLFALADKEVFGFFGYGRVVPFSLGLEEEGKRVGANLDSVRY